MPTINEIVNVCESEVSDAQEREARARAEIQGIISTAQHESRAFVSPDEANRTDMLFKDIELARAAGKRAEARLSKAREVAADEERLTAQSRDVRDTGARPASRTASYSVTRTERTYRPDTDPNGRNFLLDVARAAVFHDVRSRERLERHSREEEVERPGYGMRAAGDATTTAYGVGLVVPQYLTDLYAPAIAAMRPLANVANHHDLPDQGMTLNLSKITTATSAGLQATQLTAVSGTSLAETDLSINVQTVAGFQNVSRQAIERGTGIEDVTAGDLFKRVATVLDSTLINQATTGISAAAQSTTYTSASPTGPEFWPFMYQAESKLEQALLSQARVNYVCMHPRRFNWLASQVGTSWPFMGSLNSGVPPQQSMMQVTNQYGVNVRAVLANGLQVVVDANVPTNLGVGTNQDEVYVLASDEVHLWESPNAPFLIRAEQPNAASLGVLLVAYQYVAYTVQRYANNPGKISGTGLVAPTGF
jgi:HK97 family phage major capsid protein